VHPGEIAVPGDFGPSVPGVQRCIWRPVLKDFIAYFAGVPYSGISVSCYRDRFSQENRGIMRRHVGQLTEHIKIVAAVDRNPFHKARLQSHLFNLQMYIKMLLQYQHLSALEKQIDSLAKEIEECRIIQSILGVGEKIAATIISERRDRFNHPKKLVAFAGVGRP
jgi:transposase